MLSRRHQRGLSLIEAMIALAIGFFLLLGLTTFLANNLSSNASTLKAARLNQELRSVMTLMVREIRRAGYWSSPTVTSGALSGIGAGSAFVNPFASVTTSTAGCILFSYDGNANGTLNTASPDERYGFLLSGGIIMMRGTGATIWDCTANANNAWGALTDSKSSSITALTFSKTDSSPVYMSGSSGPNIKVRSITITLTGKDAIDTSIQKSLTETVKLENDLFSPS